MSLAADAETDENGWAKAVMEFTTQGYEMISVAISSNSSIAYVDDVVLYPVTVSSALDRKEIETTLKLVPEQKEAYYSNGSWARFAKAYEAAKILRIDAMASQEDINAGATELQEAFAGLTKSAQFPFSKWLLGAMVAPTPSSALLHSATMVKAGVYLLLRLAPLMIGNFAGYMVALVGGFTFFVASVLAITKSDGKSVLAYSTISNLGLITACAGVGTPQTVWAGIALVIFHAVSKSLLFQTVGAIENTTGSRNIEDMTGLIKKYPYLGTAIGIGIAAMYLAPFGMLISKWAALKSFIDSGNVILVLFLCFGSATTLFYWSKWLCKILTHSSDETCDNKTSSDQWVSIGTHMAMAIALCAAFPVIANKLLQPLVESIYGSVGTVLSDTDIIIMVIMLVSMVVIPVIGKFMGDSIKTTDATEYVAGINLGDNGSFVDSFGGSKQMHHANWYMTNIVNENKWHVAANFIASGIIVICGILAIIQIGGAF